MTIDDPAPDDRDAHETSVIPLGAGFCRFSRSGMGAPVASDLPALPAAVAHSISRLRAVALLRHHLVRHPLPAQLVGSCRAVTVDLGSMGVPMRAVAVGAIRCGRQAASSPQCCCVGFHAVIAVLETTLTSRGSVPEVAVSWSGRGRRRVAFPPSTARVGRKLWGEFRTQ